MWFHAQKKFLIATATRQGGTLVDGTPSPGGRMGDCRKYPPHPGKGGQWYNQGGDREGSPYCWGKCDYYNRYPSEPCSGFGNCYHLADVPYTLNNGYICEGSSYTSFLCTNH